MLGEDIPLQIKDEKPYTILVLGVNGAGKTTTIGKLASRFATNGHRVLVAAGDTFPRSSRGSTRYLVVNVLGQNSFGAVKMLNPPLSVFDAISRREASRRGCTHCRHCWQTAYQKTADG